MCPHIEPYVPAHRAVCACTSSRMCPQPHLGVPANPAWICQIRPRISKNRPRIWQIRGGGTHDPRPDRVCAASHKSVVIRSGARRRPSSASRAPSGARRLAESSYFADSGGCTTGCFLSSLRLGIGRGRGRFQLGQEQPTQPLREWLSALHSALPSPPTHEHPRQTLHSWSRRSFP
jgi:hypothetical protein